MVKKLVLGIALSFASAATAAETQTVKFMMPTPGYVAVTGAIYSHHNGACDNPTEILHDYLISPHADAYIDLEKDSLFCIRSCVEFEYDAHDYGPYRVTADCTSFIFGAYGILEQANCKAATIDLVVKNSDRWGFDVKLFYPDASNPNDPCTLSSYPSKEELTRIPEDTKSVVSLPYDHNLENPNVCLYLENYKNPTNLYRKSHGPFLKTGGLIVIHDTKTVTQERQ